MTENERKTNIASAQHAIPDNCGFSASFTCLLRISFYAGGQERSPQPATGLM
ncbi:MAG: hypothetical protein ACLFQS_06480 [Bacteroidales bacterium]